MDGGTFDARCLPEQEHSQQGKYGDKKSVAHPGGFQEYKIKEAYKDEQDVDPEDQGRYVDDLRGGKTGIVPVNNIKDQADDGAGKAYKYTGQERLNKHGRLLIVAHIEIFYVKK